MNKIAIIDYRAGNLFSVLHACSYVGLDAEITSDKSKILSADGVILPGVGAFGEAMDNLKKLDLISPIKDAIQADKPFLGICLGLQLLFSESEEFGIFQGLDIIKGRVVKFPPKNKQGQLVRVPQIGWNKIYSADNLWKDSPLSGLNEGEFMYFVHSYYVCPEARENILSLASYEGIEYCSSVVKNNLFACQFHPEKSASEGIKIYQNWAKQVKTKIK